MNSKSKLNELKNKLLEKSQKNNVLKEASENFNLDNKVDNFIDWYQKNMVNDRYTNIGKFYKPNDMRNFIEKVAVWYELRYPDYEINKMMPGSSYDNVDVNDIMFKNNNYINEAYNKLSDAASKKKYDRMWNSKIGKKRAREEKKETKKVSAAEEVLNMFFGAQADKSIVNKKTVKTKNIPVQGENIETEIDVTIEEAFYGNVKKISLRTIEGKMKTFEIKIPEGIRDG